MTKIVIWICALVVVFGLLLFMVDHSGNRSATYRTGCRNNLKQIGLALHNYRDKYGCFPPAYVVDKNGKPAHSWRVLLLPFLDHQSLYDEYRFDEPWNGPNNSKLAGRMPYLYRCPTYGDYLTRNILDSGELRYMTNYVAIVAPNGVFSGPEATSIQQIADDPANTLALAETSRHLVHWMSPRDSVVDEILADVALTAVKEDDRHTAGQHALHADGRVQFLVGKEITKSRLNAYITRDGGEVIED